MCSQQDDEAISAVWRSLTVSDEECGRLDGFLAGKITGLSRRAAVRMIAAGEITVNGARSGKNRMLRSGDEVVVAVRPALGKWPPCADGAVGAEILYRDDAVAVLDKPAGIPSVPLRPSETGTLAGFAAAMFPGAAGIGRRSGDGGLLQRLDTETSGAVMAALTEAAYTKLAELQRAGGVEKCYLALVKGVPPTSFVIETSLEKSGPKGAKMRPSPDGDGARARTSVSCRSVHGSWSLVEAVILHGARHQIRVHLASEGYPLAGDTLYGDGGGPPGLARLFLHAHRLTFAHPVKGNTVSVTSPLPEALVRVLAGLSAAGG